MADVDVDDFLGARRRSAAIRPREAAIGRRLVLDRGRGPGRAESQFSFKFFFSFSSFRFIDDNNLEHRCHLFR